MNGTQARDLTEEFLQNVHALPHGEKIDQCLQCGTCSASCPTSAGMKYAPRTILAALRAGKLQEVLESLTVWLCASCYSCTVRCPAGIPLTEVIYELKRLGIKKRLVSERTEGRALAESFVAGVYQRGRSNDAELIGRYVLRTHLSKAFSLLPLAWKLFRKGRLSLQTHSITGVEGLQRMIDAMGKGGA